MRRSLLCALLCLTLPLVTRAQERPQLDPRWVNISHGIVKQLEAEGKKFDWPGGTSGVTVDPSNGDVYMVVTGQGIWRSTDAGQTFSRSDGGKVGGRCETSYSLNFDPAGKRLACFMLDGKCAWTGDRGKTWNSFTDVGRNWDYAAVDWSAEKPQHLFAALHESGGQVMTSSDGGRKWNQLFQDAEFDKSGGLGIFDAQTLVYTQKGKGILRSTDFGQTWTKVDDRQPIGRVVQVCQGTGYWLAQEGLLVSTDRGATWKLQGKPADGVSLGPWIDPQDERRMVTAGVKGIYQTVDGGQSWTRIAGAFPHKFDFPKHGWYTTVAWDPVRDLIYISKMGEPTYRWQNEKP